MTQRTLVALLVCCIPGLPLTAAASYTITIADDVTRHPGDLVGFRSQFSDADGLTGIDLDIAFDPAVLRLTGVRSDYFADRRVSATACDDDLAPCYDSGVTGGLVTISAIAALGLAGVPQSAPLFNLDFAVLPGATLGDTKLTYQRIDLYDADANAIEPTAINQSGARLTVTGVPLAAPWLLLLPGLTAVAARRRTTARAV